MNLREKLAICYTWHILNLDILKSIKEELDTSGKATSSKTKYISQYDFFNYFTKIVKESQEQEIKCKF